MPTAEHPTPAPTAAPAAATAFRQWIRRVLADLGRGSEASVVVKVPPLIDFSLSKKPGKKWETGADQTQPDQGQPNEGQPVEERPDGS
jgi:hypothetical protein